MVALQVPPTRVRGVFNGGQPWTRGRGTEGKVAAPEAVHAIRAVVDEALAAKETGEEKVILFNYCGHGFLDLSRL